MTTLLVELRNALDRRWRRDRALRPGLPLALALLCTGAALFRWIEFLGARPVPSELRERREERRNSSPVRTLIFDQGSFDLEIRPTDRLTGTLRRLGAIPHEILDVRRGDFVVLWIGPLGTFTPVPRAPILSTLASILLFLTAIALRSTRHPHAVELERWTSGTPPGWIESTSHESDGTTVHRLRREHPGRHGLALCSFLLAAFAAFAVIMTGLASGFLGELPELRAVALGSILGGAPVLLILPLAWLERSALRFEPDHLEVRGVKAPWASIRDVIVHLRGDRLFLRVGDRQIPLGPAVVLWTAGLLEGRGIPVRLETD